MFTEKIISQRDQLPLELAVIEPEGPPIGIVQILHGMAEHKERYYNFMEYLADKGYICVIHDHRGHGASVREPGQLGYFYTEDGSMIVDDAFQVTEYIKDRSGALKLCLFSHSMGTLVARNYLKKYDDQIDRLVLCGPPTKNGMVKLAQILARVSQVFYKEDAPNPFLNALALGPYNKGFAEKNGWISSDKEAVAAYNSDPLCGFVFTTNAFINLFQLQRSAFESKDWIPQNRQLPILLIAGAEDPVIQSEAKFYALEKFLNDLGYVHTRTQLYKKKRHELLNEQGHLDVYKDIWAFME